MIKDAIAPLVQLSGRGQITLPASIRRELGLHGGDAFMVRIEEGCVVLEPVEVLPVERYTEARLREFRRESELSEAELTEAREKWGL